MKESLQYLKLAVKRNLVGAQQHMNYYGTTLIHMFMMVIHIVYPPLVKHYAFLVDGSADASVKSFLEGNKTLEEFQKVVLPEDCINIIIDI